MKRGYPVKLAFGRLIGHTGSFVGISARYSFGRHITDGCPLSHFFAFDKSLCQMDNPSRFCRNNSLSDCCRCYLARGSDNLLKRFGNNFRRFYTELFGFLMLKDNFKIVMIMMMFAVMVVLVIMVMVMFD